MSDIPSIEQVKKSRKSGRAQIVESNRPLLIPDFYRKRGDAWRRLAESRGKLLACYRLHKRPSDGLLEDLEREWKTLQDLGEIDAEDQSYFGREEREA